MSEVAHAKLSASGSDRWMNCPGSVREESKFPKPPSSAYAAKGTEAHEYAEKLLRCQIEVADIPAEHLDVVVPYRDYVLGFQGHLFIEHRFHLEWLHPQMFGTADTVLLADTVLHVMDLKSGQGVRVDAKDNSQLLYYALGAWHDYQHLFDIKTVIVHIVQPRLNHYDTFELSIKDLLAFAERLKAAAVATENAKAELVPGDHCRWCRAKTACPKMIESAQKLAAIDFSDPELSIEDLLALVDIVEPLIEEARSKAKTKILSGEQVIGWKVVNGRKTRAWKNEDEVALAFKGVTEAFTEPKLKTVAQVEKALKGVDLEPFVESKPGSPTLVKDSDKRTAITTVEMAVKDFE